MQSDRLASVQLQRRAMVLVMATSPTVLVGRSAHLAAPSDTWMPGFKPFPSKPGISASNAMVDALRDLENS
jgi:hypothetical protein